MILFICDVSARAITPYPLEQGQRVPLMKHVWLRAEEFFSCTDALVAWTDSRALMALDALGEGYGAPFQVSGLFRRAGEGDASLARRCGTAFCLGADLPPEQRGELRRLAISQGLFDAVQPPFNSGRRVYAAITPRREERFGAPVFALQDSLIAMGHLDVTLTGVLDTATQRALARNQIARRSPAKGAPPIPPTP